MSALFAYNFGKQALEGVNPTPEGIKLPKVNPNVKDAKDSAKDGKKPEPKPSPAKQSDARDFLLDEAQVIADFKARSQQELGSIRRPAFVASLSGDRRAYAKTYVTVDRALARVRDPLAISASADQRIADRIAELRQRVYVSSRSYGDFDNVALGGDRNDRLTMPEIPQPITQSQSKPLGQPLIRQSDFRQQSLKPSKPIVELMPSDMNLVDRSRSGR